MDLMLSFPQSRTSPTSVATDPLHLDALLTGMVGNRTKERRRGEGLRDRGGAAGEGEGVRGRGGGGRLLNTPGGSDQRRQNASTADNQQYMPIGIYMFLY